MWTGWTHPIISFAGHYEAHYKGWCWRDWERNKWSQFVQFWWRTKKLLHERIAKAISNHIDDKYDYWDLVRSLAGKYFGYYNNRGGSKQHQWICSNIIAEIFKQAGLFKNNVNVYSFLPDSFSSKKINANCCFVKGMNLEIEQKLIYH